VKIDAERPTTSVFRQICNELEEKLFGKRFETPKAIFVVGGPGAGKGTQCGKLKENLNFHHYSTGDLLRAEVATGSELGQEIKKIQDEGGLVSSDLLVDILRVNMEHKQGVFLLDGFPRNQENVDAWNAKMNGVCNLEFLLNYDVDPVIMEDRMLERAKTSGRSDDNPETIKKRLATFSDLTKPIIAYFESKKQCVTIDADGDVETVYNRTLEKINKLILDFQNAIPKVIFLCGGPGSGKGTQCDLIKEKYPVIHQNTGELLRAEVAKGEKLGKQIKKI
jgi:adenylate kinase